MSQRNRNQSAPLGGQSLIAFDRLRLFMAQAVTWPLFLTRLRLLSWL